MEQNIDLVSNPKKSFWKLSIPIVAFFIFDAIYGIVDMAWVSQISFEAFFAIGVSVPFVTLIFSLGDAVGKGTNSMMSRFLGSGEYESANNTLIHGMILSNIMWVVLVLCLLFAHGILFYIDRMDSYVLVFDYMVPLVIFAYIFIFINLFSQTLQAEGNSTLPSALIIISNILNIILDPIMIFNFNLGVKGAAYATVISAVLAFVVLTYYYSSGRSKIKFSLKYFKFHTYIIVEIFKVALPTIVDRGVWCFATSFINSILAITMGEPGPLLYSVCNKLKGILIAPTRGNSYGLMSVSGHLFGAGKFDEVKDLFYYTLNVSFIITLISMIIFFVFREGIFALFSITGMETEIFWTGIGGTIFMMALTYSMTSSRMLDGFGKSVYVLALTFADCFIQLIIIYVFFTLQHHGSCVLIGMVCSEVTITFAYYFLLRHLFNNFGEKYESKDTVKHFGKDKKSEDIDDKIDVIVDDTARKVPSKIPLIIAIIGMAYIVLKIISIPIRTQNYAILTSGIISLIICGINIYLMEMSNKPKLAIIGFFGISMILLVFMGRYGYFAACLFIIAGILILYIDKIIKKLKQLM